MCYVPLRSNPDRGDPFVKQLEFADEPDALLRSNQMESDDINAANAVPMGLGLGLQAQ